MDGENKLDELLRLLAGIELTLRHEYSSTFKDQGLIRVLQKKKVECLDKIRKEIYGTTF